MAAPSFSLNFVSFPSGSYFMQYFIPPGMYFDHFFIFSWQLLHSLLDFVSFPSGSYFMWYFIPPGFYFHFFMVATSFSVIFHSFLAVVSIIFSFIQGSYFILPCFQGSSNGSSRWSHDLLPKMMKKIKIVVLHCSFWNLF